MPNENESKCGGVCGQPPARTVEQLAASQFLQAQKDLNLYRTVGVKVSNISGKRIDFTPVEFIAGPTRSVAVMAYTKLYGLHMTDDDAGSWVVSTFRLEIPHTSAE